MEFTFAQLTGLSSTCETPSIHFEEQRYLRA